MSLSLQAVALTAPRYHEQDSGLRVKDVGVYHLVLDHKP